MTMMSDSRCEAEAYLESCALGYAVSVQSGDRRVVDLQQFNTWAGAKSALHDAGVRLAAALGQLDAAERAELTALRRLREGIEGMRGEVATGKTDLGEPVTRALVVETIDALLYFASPHHAPAKEPVR